MKQIKIAQFKPWYYEMIKAKYLNDLKPIAQSYLRFHSCNQMLAFAYNELRIQATHERQKVVLIVNQALTLLQQCLQITFEGTFRKDFHSMIDERSALLRCYCHSLQHLQQEDIRYQQEIERSTLAFRVSIIGLKAAIVNCSPILKTMFVEIDEELISKLIEMVERYKGMDTAGIVGRYRQAYLDMMEGATKSDYTAFVRGYFQLKFKTLVLKGELQNKLQFPMKQAAEIRESRKSKQNQKLYDHHLTVKFLPAMRKLSSLAKAVNKSRQGEFTRFLQIMLQLKDVINKKAKKEGFLLQELVGSQARSIQPLIANYNQLMALLEEMEGLAHDEIGQEEQSIKNRFPFTEEFSVILQELLEHWSLKESVGRECKRIKSIVESIILKEFKLKIQLLIF